MLRGHNLLLWIVVILLIVLALTGVGRVDAAGETWQWGACPWSAGCDAMGRAILPPNGDTSMPAPVVCPATLSATEGVIYVDGVPTSTVTLLSSSVISISNSTAITVYLRALTIRCTDGASSESQELPDGWQMETTAALTFGDLLIALLLMFLVGLQIVILVRSLGRW